MLIGFDDGGIDAKIFKVCLFEEKTRFDDEHYFKLYKQISGDRYLQPYIELDWNEENMDSLRKKFPLLWDRYSQNPLE